MSSGQNWSTQRSRRFFATIKLLVTVYIANDIDVNDDNGNNNNNIRTTVLLKRVTLFRSALSRIATGLSCYLWYSGKPPCGLRINRRARLAFLVSWLLMRVPSIYSLRPLTVSHCMTHVFQLCPYICGAYRQAIVRPVTVLSSCAAAESSVSRLWFTTNWKLLGCNCFSQR